VVGERKKKTEIAIKKENRVMSFCKAITKLPSLHQISDEHNVRETPQKSEAPGAAAQ
jgi:hypothetical protein